MDSNAITIAFNPFDNTKSHSKVLHGPCGGTIAALQDPELDPSSYCSRGINLEKDGLVDRSTHGLPDQQGGGRSKVDTRLEAKQVLSGKHDFLWLSGCGGSRAARNLRVHRRQEKLPDLYTNGGPDDANRYAQPGQRESREPLYCPYGKIDPKRFPDCVQLKRAPFSKLRDDHVRRCHINGMQCPYCGKRRGTQRDINTHIKNSHTQNYSSNKEINTGSFRKLKQKIIALDSKVKAAKNVNALTIALTKAEDLKQLQYSYNQYDDEEDFEPLEANAEQTDIFKSDLSPVDQSSVLSEYSSSEVTTVVHNSSRYSLPLDFHSPNYTFNHTTRGHEINTLWGGPILNAEYSTVNTSFFGASQSVGSGFRLGGGGEGVQDHGEEFYFPGFISASEPLPKPFFPHF